jgi:hypothetical protein
MKEHPILFSEAMVRAILGGHKTATRRVIKPQPPHHEWSIYPSERLNIQTSGGQYVHCPYGQVGDQLWVREAFVPDYFDDGRPGYKADWTATAAEYVKEPKWKPSIFMPYRLSRIFLDIVAIRVEQLKEISNEDAKAEGVGWWQPVGGEKNYRIEYQQLWDKLNAKRGFGWDVNPWVWVIEFTREMPWP